MRSVIVSETITDAGLRAQTLERVARDWYRQDQDAASVWLLTSGMPEETVAKIAQPSERCRGDFSLAPPSCGYSLPEMKLTFLSMLLSLACAANAQLVRQANTTLNLPAQLPTATGYRTENALGDLRFSSPIDVASPPGVTNRLFVIERGSGIRIVDLDEMSKATFMRLTSYLTSDGRRLRTDVDDGVLGLTFHPRYNENGYFYVFYSFEENRQLFQRVARFTATGTPGNYNEATEADPTTEAPLITQSDERNNHQGGDMEFGPDGYLYITVGDEGEQHDGNDNARRIAKDFLGGILRIDVDNKPGSLPPNPHDESSTSAPNDSAITSGSYMVPADNPWVALADGTGQAAYNGFTFEKTAVRTELYAIGLRNVWRMSFDPLTGRLFAGDVGQDAYEEIDIITKGFNGGWSWREGMHSHRPARAPRTEPDEFEAQDPIYEYDHRNNGDGNDDVIYGNSVTGGVVYRGDRFPELFGKYIFSDYTTGRIAALTEQADGTWTGERIATDNNICGFGYDPRNGDALMCDFTSGQVKRLVRRGTEGTEPPATLSATGAFSDLGTLTPNEGLVPYAPNVDFWSDHATKSRWFAIKNTEDTIEFSADSAWTLPTGMVWVKHFDIDTTRDNSKTRRRLETRFLVKTESDIYGLSYKWRDDQSDADLVAEDGLSEMIPASSPTQEWRYPSRSECFTCHTHSAGLALSFNTRQLNRMHSFSGEDMNQIAALQSAGYFAAPTADPKSLPSLAAATDETASLEWRVRSYLDTNCAQCHQPGGASSGNWDARATTPTDFANLINGLLVNDGGDPNNRWSVPGDADHSMILKRLSGEGAARMPPLATGERDLVAEKLISDWIMSELPNRESFAQWQMKHFGSTELEAAQPEFDADFDGTTNYLEFLVARSPLVVDGSILNGTRSSEGITLNFEQLANRSGVVETTTDFNTWTLWEVPGNAVFFPAGSKVRSLTGPVDSPGQYFRLRLSQP